MKPGSLIERAWGFAKIGTRVPIGPLALHLRLARTVHVSRDDRHTSRPVRSEATSLVDSKLLTGPGTESATHPPVAHRSALIVGTGPGLGSALARRFSTAGMAVAMVARNTRKLDKLANELIALGRTASRYGCDASDERGVKAMLNRVVEDMGIPDVVV